MNLALVILLMIISSCANWGQAGLTRLEFQKSIFRLTDLYTETRLVRERGMSQGERFTVKRKVTSLASNELILEKSISISKMGTHKNGFTTLVPERSQFQVWYDGKRYFSDIKIDIEHNKVEVSLKSPEKRWRGRREVALPGKGGIYCFYSQLIECIRVTGFIDKAIKKGMGEMNFYLIMDGYPYWHHHLSNLKSEVISVAKFSLDGTNRRDETSFNLEFGGQVIFFHVDKNRSLIKMFWVAQGISIVKESSIK